MVLVVRFQEAGRGLSIVFCLSPVLTRRSLDCVTTANKITIFRILLIPFFVIEVLYYVRSGEEIHRLIAMLCFLTAAICDGLDGYIARRYNQWSELGVILDPLADKLLLVSGVVLLSFNNGPHLGQLPFWLTGTIIGRDILILIGLAVIHMAAGKVKVRPRMLGKIATVFQMICIVWILLKWDDGFGAQGWGKQSIFYLTLAAAICTGISGILYVIDGIRQLSASPSSLPSKPPEK